MPLNLRADTPAYSHINTYSLDMKDSQQYAIETKAIHAGQEPDPATGAIMTPIYQTSTYVQAAPGDNKGYEYARTANPTRAALEACLAALEGVDYGYCFGSGMAATDAVIHLLNPGDEVLCTSDIYGGSYRLFTQVYAKYGIQFRFVNLSDMQSLESHITDKTKMVWLETPTNPSLHILDLSTAKKVMEGKNILLVVDNTFATPYLQQPFQFGADIVVHSATKYLSGHSDVVLGAVLVKDKALAEQIKFTQKSVGGVCGPMDAFLVLRGVKTLHVRMDRHCENGMAIAKMLAEHPAVAKVNFPGLPNHPGHKMAGSQMKKYGGMMSFTLKNDTKEAAVKVMQSTRIFSLAESLGGVESLISHPASMTHAAIPAKERYEAGISDSLIRVSVGIEKIDDLLADLKQALDTAM